MRGRTIFGKRKRTRRIQQRGEIKIQFHLGFIGDFERRGERDANGICVARQMISPAVELAGGVAPQTFEREKNKSTLPAPVQSVEIWIERMAGGKAGDVRVIQICVQSNQKPERAEFARRNFI